MEYFIHIHYLLYKHVYVSKYNIMYYDNINKHKKI